MSTGRSNAMDALPRASFLTYFRTPDHPKRRKSERCQRGRAPCRTHCSQAPLLPRIPEDATAEDNADEESRLGDFEHFDHCDGVEQRDHGWSYTDILSFAGYTLLVLLIVLNLDFLLSAYNANTGLVKWDGREVKTDSSGREMHFCLTEQDRLAPTSRVWRYVPRDSYSGCTTRVLTIHADASEEHKLFTEDIIAGEAMVKSTCSRVGGGSKRDVPASNAFLERGDDLAEEGRLSRKAEPES